MKQQLNTQPRTRHIGAARIEIGGSDIKMLLSLQSLVRKFQSLGVLIAKDFSFTF